MNHWIDSNTKLQQMCEQLAQVPKLAVDTEFIRTDTFYPKIALIQISDGEQCWLVDVLAIDDFSALKALLESSDHQLIFHACAEDLEVLEYALDIKPTQIFDTQIAAGIVNIGYCMGYARLVDTMFDVTLDKQETRSDWLARPLTQRQLDYAAVDVQYLHAMEKILAKALEHQQRHDWFAEETQGLFALVEGRKDHRDYYLRLKGAWRLGVKSLTALNRLCDWRENTARAINRPRAHVIKDSVLIELAKRLPQAQEQLQGIDDWFPRSVKRHGQTVLQQIADSASDNPVPPMPQPLPKAISMVMREMRDSLGRVAQDIQIPQEFLCNKKELEVILRSSMEGHCQWPERLTQGWRLARVQPVLQEVLNSTEAL
ncbi:MAG: ribonuclease D [Porticoccaceae bacterium]|jgi:ribonuclease D|nr:ribonuclease D [Porticoccaceae bacterium]